MSSLRVVGGTAKGRKLKTVPGDTTRPVLDRVRTALFDVLRPTIQDKRVLDLFAGTGSIGIEALSQGASHCIFLDLEKQAVEIIKENLETTELLGHAEVRHTDAFTFIKNTSKSFDLIYIAPPQYEGIWERALMAVAERPELLNPEGQVIVQIDPSEYTELYLAHLHERTQRTYGNTLLIFYELLGR